MQSEGIKAVYLTTHNWGKAVKFFQALGYKVDFETDHNSGQLRNGAGPYLFIAEVPADQDPEVQIVMQLDDETAFRPDSVLDVVTPFEDTHWHTREMSIRDPDGRIWRLEASARAQK